MNIQLHKPEWLRWEHWLIWALVLAALLLLLVPHTADFERLIAAPTVETRAPSSIPAPPVVMLPFTVWEVAEYFSTVLEMSPHTGANGATVFENQQVMHPEDRWRIAVSMEGPGVTVEFTVGGDYGLTLAREFFESPFFELAESEEFYAMLNEARNAPVKNLRRFTVAMTFAETTDLQMLILRFMPRDAA